MSHALLKGDAADQRAGVGLYGLVGMLLSVSWLDLYHYLARRPDLLGRGRALPRAGRRVDGPCRHREGSTMTTVGEFMTTRLVTMDGNDTLISAAQEMRDSAIGDVVVTDGDSVVGIVTDRDITVRGVAENMDPGSTRLNQITTRDVITVSQYDDAVAAADLMRTYAVRRLPVIDDGRLVGLISMGDLAVEREPQSVLADISADDPNN